MTYNNQGIPVAPAGMGYNNNTFVVPPLQQTVSPYASLMPQPQNNPYAALMQPQPQQATVVISTEEREKKLVKDVAICSTIAVGVGVAIGYAIHKHHHGNTYNGCNGTEGEYNSCF